MPILYLVSVWVHIIAAMFWVGGTLFMTLVLIPLVRRPELAALAPRLVQLTGERFRLTGYVSLGVLLVTGIVNAGYRGFTWTNVFTPAPWQSSFGHVFATKVAAFALILVVSAVHDFWIGRRAMAAWRAAPGSPEAKAARGQATMLARLNLLLALVVVACAVMVVRGMPG